MLLIAIFFRSIDEIPGTDVVLEKNIISDCVLQAQVLGLKDLNYLSAQTKDI